MPHHPEAHTHVLAPYMKPRIPKVPYTTLSIPTEDSSTDDKNDFASVFLANWTSDRSASRATAQALPDWTPWAEYLAWRDSGEREVVSSMCLLQRFHDHSEVTAERSRQCKARRVQRIEACDNAEDVNALLDYSDDDSADDYDYEVDTITQDMMETEMATLEVGLGARGSLAGALKLFGHKFPSPVSTTPLGNSCIQSVNIKDMASAASARDKQLSGVRTVPDTNGELSICKSDNGVISALLTAVVRPLAEPVITTVNMNDPNQFATLFMPLRTPPSIEETIALFTLAHGQAQMFVLLATEMNEVLLARNGQPPPYKVWFSSGPLHLLVLGPPGTGKTRAQLAFQWYAYQRGVHDEILLTAYPHKAAALLNSPVLTASTTCAMMGINPMKTTLWSRTYKAFAKSQKLLEGGRWLIMDEASFYSQATLALTSRSLRQHAEFKKVRPLIADYFGAVSVVLTGDLTQHSPPVGKALTSGASWETRCEQRNKPDIRSQLDVNTDDVYGREAFKSFESVIILDKQQRMKGDPDFAAVAATFASEDPVTPQQINNFCDLVNASVPTSIDDLLHRSPRVVVTRNDIKNHVARAMDIAQVRIYSLRPCYNTLTPQYTMFPTSCIQRHFHAVLFMLNKSVILFITPA